MPFRTDNVFNPSKKAGFFVSRAAAAAAPTSFTPTDIAGLAAWYDANQEVYADDAAVTTWHDRSTNLRHVTQTTVAQQPVMKTTVVNGRRIVRFDGTDDTLTRTSAFLSGQTGSVFVVGKSDTAGSGVVSGYAFLSQADTAAASSAALTLDLVSTAAGEIRPRVFERANGVAANILRGNSTVTTAFHIFEYHSAGTSYDFRIDGTTQGLTTEAGANDGAWFGDITSTVVSVGALLYSPGQINFFDGDMAEMVVYDGVTLTSAQKSQVRMYLSSNYAIAATT
jgi:hypothetical protein